MILFGICSARKQAFPIIEAMPEGQYDGVFRSSHSAHCWELGIDQYITHKGH